MQQRNKNAGSTLNQIQIQASSVWLAGMVDFERRIGWEGFGGRDLVGGNPKCRFSEAYSDSQLGTGRSTILVRCQSGPDQFELLYLHMGMRGHQGAEMLLILSKGGSTALPGAVCPVWPTRSGRHRASAA